MHNILLVDDEPIVRIGLKTVVDWHELGFNIAGEASEGRQALSILKEREIDAVITDIKMPVMDGIELISSIKETNPNIVIIALSSYDDYEFVKKAFKLGIHDYLLKSDINEKNITKLLNEIGETIKENKKNYPPKNVKANAAEEKKTKMLREIITSNNQMNSEEINNKLGEFGWGFKDKHVALAVISVYKYIEVKKKYYSDDISKLHSYIENIIQEAANKFGDFSRIRVGENEVILLFSGPKSEDIDRLREKIAEICSYITLHAKRFINISTMFGVSNISSAGYADIKKLYCNAKSSQEHSFIDGPCRTIWYYQIKKIKKTDNDSKINEHVRNLKKILSGQSYHDYDETVKQVIVSKSKLNGLSIENIKKIYNIYSSLLFEYIELNDIAKELEDKIKKFIHLNKCESSLDELNSALEGLLLQLHTFDVLANNPIVEKVKRYANDNYNMPITSRDAAQSLDITQEHLCRIFAKETGISFTKYITELRIDKAKELLMQGNMKINQVSNIIGYANIYYFSKVFKRETGFAPSEYAKKNINMI